MDNEPLVSIITPCFNGEKYLQRFLDSVINQTYRRIEFIFINDGSLDNTESIALAYLEKFKLKKYQFIYLYQDNKGQAAAINRGLKIFSGNYITWPDSDDILHEDNIKNRVNFLEEHRYYDIILCESILADESFKEIGVVRRVPPKLKDDLFHDLIIENNVYFAGGAYMIRATSFINTNPQRNIYESRGGQNWQMLLPVLYKNKCGYLNEKLYYITVNPKSHSRQVRSLEDHLDRCSEHEDILINIIKTIKKMPKEDQNIYFELIKKKYSRKRLLLASAYKNKYYLSKYFWIMKSNKYTTLKDFILYITGMNKIALYIYLALKKLYQALLKVRRAIYW